VQFAGAVNENDKLVERSNVLTVSVTGTVIPTSWLASDTSDPSELEEVVLRSYVVVSVLPDETTTRIPIFIDPSTVGL
jgi:hypothetical protein